MLTGAPLSLDVPIGTADVLRDEDLLLALHCCYELHYRGLAGVGDDREWDPGLLAFRARLEALLEPAVRALAAQPEVAPTDLPRALMRPAADGDAPSLAAFVQLRADRGQCANCWCTGRSTS